MRTHTKSLSLLIVFAVFASSVSAKDPETAASAVLQDNYPQHRASFSNGVVGLANLNFSTLDGFRPLTLDVYLPPGEVTSRTKGRPLVVYIHGGGWTGGHSRNSGTFVDFPGVLASLAAKGYVVSSVNYRLSREAPFPAAIQDIKAAIRWLRGHSSDYGIDKSRVLVWGGSAGGQLAALAATTCGVAALEPPKPANASSVAESDCVQGAVLWYSTLDFATLIQAQASDPNAPLESPIARYLNCALKNCPPTTVRLASPIAAITKSTPPVLLIHGADDSTVPVSQSQMFYEQLKATGVKAELLIIPDVNHSFIGKTVESTHQASVQALNKTWQFIDATVGKP